MERERNGFSIIGFIAQILVILLFIFVLMWLFPTKSYIENNTNNGVNNENNTNNVVNNEILFNQNLLSMKDAAREYFTNSRMPKKDGESITLTLEEMIEKNMVVELIDGNANKCDVKTSYVKVTKVDEEYEMIVTLTCSGVTKTIKTTVGCYNYCDSDLCEKDEEVETTTKILYQYKKTTDPISKWSDWSNWSKNKVTATSTRKVETKVVNENIGTKTEISDPKTLTIYSCPTGYSLSNDMKTCYKNTSSTDKVQSIKTTTYSCPTGYSLSNDKTKCTKITYLYKNPVAIYECRDSEYELDGTKCVKIETTTAIPHVSVSFDCATGPCKTITTIDYYYCSNNSYKLTGKTCTKTDIVDAVISDYECPTGYRMNSTETKCYKATTSTINSTPTYSYSCPSNDYTLSADKKTCSKIVNTTLTANPSVKYSYSCAVGTLNKNNKCENIVDVYEDVTYYRYRTYETTPGKTYTKWSESNNDKTLINQGYKYTGVTKKVTSK